MSTTKYKLEYSYPNEIGNNASDKLVDTNLITTHKRIEFTSQYVVSLVGTMIIIDWNNGNFQKSSLSGSSNTWINLQNPGIVGRYELLIMKTVAGSSGLVFGDYTWINTNIDWLNGYPDFNRVSVDSGLIITFRWNGYKYTAMVGYLENHNGIVTAGYSHSMYIIKDVPNYIRVWGYNTDGQFGSGILGSISYFPTIPKHNKIFNYISAGYDYSLGIDYQGKPWGWGNNTNGRVGDDTITNRCTPVAICGGHTFCSISGGRGHSLAIDINGQVWAWGSNTHGNLGNNNIFTRLTPVSIHGIKKTFCSISVGFDHSLAIDINGHGWSWGRNGYGHIGDNTTSVRYTPIRVCGNHTFCKISAGEFVSFGIDNTGQVWGWGNNYANELGILIAPESCSVATPMSIHGTKKTFCRISTSYKFTLAIDYNGQVWSWGSNNTHGQLGNNNTLATIYPISIHGTKKTFCDISTGVRHSLAIDYKGRAWGWGYGYYGELGDNSATDRYTPVRVCYI